MKKKVKNQSKLFPASIGEIIKKNIKNIEELDKLTISEAKKRIVEIAKPRELLIWIDAENKKTAKSISQLLSTINGFTVCPVYKNDGVWTVKGSKMVLFEQVEKEINMLRAMTRPPFCEFNDWLIECDQVG